MERRNFLRILPVPLVAALPGAKAVAAPMHSGHYLLFVDPMSVDVEDVARMPGLELPKNCSINIVPVRLLPGETIDDCVRLYEVPDARP